MKNRAGVYEIVNTVNGKRYIGSSATLTKRKYEHIRTLRLGTHRCVKLQRAWNKYGEGAFVFNTLLYCAKARDALCFYEQLCFDGMRPEYNIAPIAGSNLGVKHPPEFGAKISARKKGKRLRPRTPKERAAISARKKGVPLSQIGAKKAAAQCRVMASANVGRVHTDAARKNFSEAQRGNKKGLGVKHTPERNATIAGKLKGRTRPTFSQAWRDAISAAHKGRPKSEETKRKMSIAASTRKRNPDGTYTPKGSL